MSLAHRNRDHIFLIGDTTSQFIANRLPTNKQVLQVLIYNIQHLKKSKRESLTSVVKQIKDSWNEASIPMQADHRVQKKLDLLYNEYFSVKKNKNLSKNAIREQSFRVKLSQLFDVAHGNVMNMIQIDQKNYLLNQGYRRSLPIEETGCVEEQSDEFEG